MLPTVADVLALEPVKLGSPRVVAGAGALGAPVRWVHVIELAEAGHLLRGGELVLSTGIALPPDPDGLETPQLLAGFAGRSRAAVISGRMGYDLAAGWLVTVVGSRGDDWGRLIFVLPDPPDPGTLVLAELAATTLALARLGSDRHGESPERAAHRSVLAALAGSAYADPADLEARIVALGVPLAGRVLIPVVIRVAGGENTPGDMASALATACRDLRLPAIAGTLDDRQAGALLALAAGADHDAALTRLAARLRRAGALGAPQVIGAGTGVAGVAELPRGFGDAASAAAAAAGYSDRGPGPRKSFARLPDLRLARRPAGGRAGRAGSAKPSRRASAPRVAPGAPTTNSGKIAAAMPSTQKWSAVTTTASVVMTGYSSASQRQRDRSAAITAMATRMAQPTCTDGIAES